MRLITAITSLWPGCSQTWRGEWRGLALAVGFGVALNGALISTFGLTLETGLPRITVVTVSLLLVLGLWSIGLVWSRREVVARSPRGADQEAFEAKFRQAQHKYLRGHWIEAETLLVGLLQVDPQDVEARLLLASVQRRTKRWEEARVALQRLQEDEAAHRWRLEIETEMSRIDERESEGGHATHEESGGIEPAARAA